MSVIFHDKLHDYLEDYADEIVVKSKQVYNHVNVLEKVFVIVDAKIV